MIYSLAAAVSLRAIARRRPGLLPWTWLVVISLAIGGMTSMFLALAMLGKGGSHVDYCPNLPAGHFLECMPSLNGLLSALIIAAFVAAVIFAVGAVLVGGATVLSKR